LAVGRAIAREPDDDGVRGREPPIVTAKAALEESGATVEIK
jgi:hypothetical protein